MPALSSFAAIPNPSFTLSANKILILGLGNDILSDDAVGLHVVREIRRRLETGSAGFLAGSLEVKESAEMGLSLLDEIIGFDDLILVDAVQTRQAPPGFPHEIEPGDLRILPGMSPHFLGIGEILALGRELGLAVPKRVKIFAIEVEDPFTVSTEMTPSICQALPHLVDHVMAAAADFAQNHCPELSQGE